MSKSNNIFHYIDKSNEKNDILIFTDAEKIFDKMLTFVIKVLNKIRLDTLIISYLIIR